MNENALERPDTSRESLLDVNWCKRSLSSILSMFCVPALAVIAAAIGRSVSRSTPRYARPVSKDRPKVLVVGYGRVGKLVAELLTRTPSPGQGPSRYLAWKGSNTCSVGELPRRLLDAGRDLSARRSCEADVCVALSAAMSNAFGRDWREIGLTLPLTMGRIGTICGKGHSNDDRSTQTAAT